MPKIRILIVDDHALFLSGLGMLLKAGLESAEIREARSLAEAQMMQRVPPHLVLLDLQLRESDGLDAIRPLKLKWPAASIVVVSAHCTSENSQRAQALGCDAFVAKTESPQYLLSVMRRILRRHAGATGTVDHKLDEGRDALTPRQLDVLTLLTEGLTNRAIGLRLAVSENTVRAHVQAIMLSLGATTRTEACVTARRLGLLE